MGPLSLTKGSFGSNSGGAGSRLDRKKLTKPEKILFYIHRQQPKIWQEWLMMTVLLVYRSCFSLSLCFFLILTASIWKHSGELQGLPAWATEQLQLTIWWAAGFYIWATQTLRLHLFTIVLIMKTLHVFRYINCLRRQWYLHTDAGRVVSV